MKKIIVICFLLSGCQLFSAGDALHSSASSKFQVSSRVIAPDQHEMLMQGAPGAPVEMLKTAFKTQGTKLCADKVYLLRGMREESIPSENSHLLKGTIDCVGLDYFASETDGIKQAKILPRSDKSKK